jgi:hypothetical protein
MTYESLSSRERGRSLQGRQTDAVRSSCSDDASVSRSAAAASHTQPTPFRAFLAQALSGCSCTEQVKSSRRGRRLHAGREAGALLQEEAAPAVRTLLFEEPQRTTNGQQGSLHSWCNETERKTGELLVWEARSRKYGLDIARGRLAYLREQNSRERVSGR